MGDKNRYYDGVGSAVVAVAGRGSAQGQNVVTADEPQLRCDLKIKLNIPFILSTGSLMIVCPSILSRAGIWLTIVHADPWLQP